jgi:hypothetical protein
LLRSGPNGVPLLRFRPFAIISPCPRHVVQAGSGPAFADQLRPKLPKLAALMDDAEADVLAHMGFPARPGTAPSSTAPTLWSASTAR